ncbi:MAG: hypothetical protein ACYS9C_14350 [Planctomycetota bacterium]|jgi:hypothetical protein
MNVARLLSNTRAPLAKSDEQGIHYCAQQALSYKYVLEWMGHSSSAILDMYFTMNDRYAQAAMNSLSFNSGKVENRTVLGQSGTQFCETLPQPTHL